MENSKSDQCEIASDECKLLKAPALSERLLCDPCLQDDSKLRAHGYCVDCGHNLCVDCFKIHLKPLPSRHHQLIDKPNVSGTKSPNAPKDTCTDKCSEHRGEIVKFYCEEHEQFGCSVCITLEHRNCSVGYIPTLAEKLFQTSEYKMFKHALDSLAIKVGVRQDAVRDNILNVKIQTARNIEEIRKLRDEVNAYFDKLENEIKTLEDRIHSVECSNLSKMETLLEQQTHLKTKIEKMQNDVKEREASSQCCRMFYDLKCLKNAVAKYEKELDILERDNEVSHLSLNVHKKLISTLHDMPTKCGSIVTKEIDLSLGRSSVDVNGIVVASEELIAVTGYGTKDIFVIDRTKRRVIYKITAPHAVKGPCKYGVNEIAFWYANTIAVFSVFGKVETLKEIHNVGVKWPILSMDNLFTGFTIPRPLTIRMINTDKSIEKTLPACKNGVKLYENPHFIAVNQDETLIYVSEFDMEIVTCVTLDGDLEAQYAPHGGWDPRGIAVSRDGTVYVSDCRNNSIHVLTPVLKPVWVIDGEIFSITNPCGLAYCSKENKLFVGMLDAKHVAVLSI